MLHMAHGKYALRLSVRVFQQIESPFNRPYFFGGGFVR
jgi:hypothetical protein